jgi:hypothetical protein
MVSLTKQSNIRAFLELFICVFRLTCELILGAHVGIVLIVVSSDPCAVKRFWNVWPNLRTMENTLNVLYSTGAILLLRTEHSNSI